MIQRSRCLNFDILIIGKIVGIESKGVLVAPRLYAVFNKGKTLNFFPVTGKPDPLMCSYISLSEYYEHWEALATSKEENKYLLPANWELIHSLLKEYQPNYREMTLPEQLSEIEDVASNFHDWRAKLRHALSILSNVDSQQLFVQYNQRVFAHPSSRLKFKWVHPEEVRYKSKMLSTISGIKSLHSLLNRKLEILPMFSSQKDQKLEVLKGWKLPIFEGKTSFKYSQEWIVKLAEDNPSFFKLSSFKEPKLPFLGGK